MTSKKSVQNGTKPSVACIYVGSREHFNYLRNNSLCMQHVLNWHHDHIQNPQNEDKYTEENIQITSARKNQLGKAQTAKTVTFGKKEQKGGKEASRKDKHKRAESAPRHRKDHEKRREELQQNAQQEAELKKERKAKILAYKQQMVPYTRTFSNTRIQELYGKSAWESYGRSNTRQLVGGVVYGSQLRTFNVNPHLHGNEPQSYQSHHTAINFAKRTKLNSEGKLNLIERQLAKRLGLAAHNQTLKEGKKIVYIDVDEENMYDFMRDNHEFAKTHSQQIRRSQKDYQIEKQEDRKRAVERFYEGKRSRIEANLDESKRQSAVRDDTNRINEQVVYRRQSDEGLRFGSDRHAMNCFVDLNFPQNKAIYASELRERGSIFPQKVKGRDKRIQAQRILNFEKSRTSMYPSHYLVERSDQPEIRKMLTSVDKTGYSGVSTRA